MPAAQVSEFSTLKVGDAANTLQEYTAYTQKVDIPTDSQSTDVTTGVAGGAQVTDNIIRGAKMATFTADGLFSDAFLYQLNQIMGARGGSTIQYASGNNAPPAAGDMCWMMTGTLFSVDLNYNFGSGAATLKATWAPSEPAAVTGTYYNPGFYAY